jgi:hypothetical protein
LFFNRYDVADYTGISARDHIRRRMAGQRVIEFRVIAAKVDPDLGVIFSENRYPLFGITPLTTETPT